MPGREAVEHHLEVTKTARYWTLGDSSKAQEVWFVLHGYKQLARRFLTRFRSIAGDQRLIVAPEALSRFYASEEPGRHGSAAVVGASWMTREDRLAEIDDYVGYLDRVAKLVPELPVTVLGYSQGTATAARWVTQGRVSADRLVLWAGYVPPDLDFARAAEVFSHVELVLVRGDADPMLSDDLAERERAVLEGAGIEYRVVTYRGGHEVVPEALALVAGD
ncbi:MAG: phospholipase [Gemmatimonadota bacterium]|nr:phospholipase [Gemmatimonadota bacterium]